MPETLLRQIDLARRWMLSERTLERWRSQGEGPHHIKIGGCVRYRLSDVIAFEEDAALEMLRSAERRRSNSCENKRKAGR
ncbi:MAG: helix-turn-helix domain-containing protein [Azospirillaceae bacterium]